MATDKTTKILLADESATLSKFKSLTKTEKKHLKDVAGCTTLAAFKDTAAAHVEMRKTSKCEPCFECKNIARKLALEV